MANTSGSPEKSVVLRNSVQGTGSWSSTVIGQPAPGKRWRLVSARVAADVRAAAPKAQHIFLWSEFLPQPGLPNPNQDFFAHIRLDPGKVGHFEAGGGYGPGAPGEFHHTVWACPISLVQGMGVKFDCDAPPGTSTSYEIVFAEEDGAEAELLFHYSYPQQGPVQTIPIGGPTPGRVWRLECATVSLKVGPGAGPRLARLVRRPDGAVLAELTKFQPSAGRSGDLAATAGYSSEQTGPSAGGRGSQTVWSEPVWVRGGESLEVQFQGPPGDKGHYAVAVSRFPASAPG